MLASVGLGHPSSMSPENGWKNRHRSSLAEATALALQATILAGALRCFGATNHVMKMMMIYLGLA